MPAGNHMAVAFIETNIQSRMMNTCMQPPYDSLQPHLIEGHGHHPDKFANKILKQIKAFVHLLLLS